MVEEWTSLKLEKRQAWWFMPVYANHKESQKTPKIKEKLLVANELKSLN